MAGSMQASVTLWATCATLLAACGFCGRGGFLRVGSVALPALAFAALIFFDTQFLSPAYSAAGLFHPLILVLACFAVRAQPTAALPKMWWALAATGGVCALWGLAQIGPLGLARGQAMFEAPATLAAFLNLCLIPALVWITWRGPSPSMLVAAMVLFGGVAAAGSRGGWMGLIAGLGMALLLAQRRPRMGLRAHWPYLALVAGAGWAMAEWMRLLPWTLEGWWAQTGAGGSLLGALRELVPVVTELQQGDSSASRLELYALALGEWRESPWTGSGYLTFAHALERARADVPSYGLEQITWFVHNDYLQTLQELGPLGLAAILALVLAPQLKARAGLPVLAEREGVIALTACAGMASMAVHAMVDFPFYVPACLLAFGGLLGALDRVLGTAGRNAEAPSGAQVLRVSYLRSGAALMIVLACLQPLVSELSAAWARRELAQARPQTALYWLEVARRFQPRDWRYHWYLGQFWQGQAIAGRKPDAARFAVMAFDAGSAANPLEVRNLLGKLATHRVARGLLDPVPVTVRLDWLQAALSRAPLSGEVRLEQVLTLADLGHAERARELAAGWLREAPYDPRPRRLTRMFERGANG